MLRELGRRLRTLRGETGLQQNELAPLAGISQATLSRLERGLVRPEEPTLDQIGAALGRVLGWDQERTEKEIDALRVLAGYLPRYGQIGQDAAPVADDPWQRRLLEIYRSISPEHREWLVRAVEFIIHRPSYPDELSAA